MLRDSRQLCACFCAQGAAAGPDHWPSGAGEQFGSAGDLALRGLWWLVEFWLKDVDFGSGTQGVRGEFQFYRPGPAGGHLAERLVNRAGDPGRGGLAVYPFGERAKDVKLIFYLVQLALIPAQAGGGDLS